MGRYSASEVSEDEETGRLVDEEGEPVFGTVGGEYATWEDLDEAEQSFYEMERAGENVTGIDLREYCRNFWARDAAMDDDDLDEPGAPGAQFPD